VAQVQRESEKGNESKTLRAILLEFGAHPDIRLFRNNVGRLQDRKGRWVQYGLCVGSSDIIGWKVDSGAPVPFARFVALEVKSATGTLTKEQERFLRIVSDMGGIAACVRSVEEARVALGAIDHGTEAL
jgi:hypothetical protein